MCKEFIDLVRDLNEGNNRNKAIQLLQRSRSNLPADFDINYRTKRGYTALHFAVMHDDHDFVEKLLDARSKNPALRRLPRKRAVCDLAIEARLTPGVNRGLKALTLAARKERLKCIKAFCNTGKTFSRDEFYDYGYANAINVLCTKSAEHDEVESLIIQLVKMRKAAYTGDIKLLSWSDRLKRHPVGRRIAAVIPDPVGEKVTEWGRDFLAWLSRSDLVREKFGVTGQLVLGNYVAIEFPNGNSAKNTDSLFFIAILKGWTELLPYLMDSRNVYQMKDHYKRDFWDILKQLVEQAMIPFESDDDECDISEILDIIFAKQKAEPEAWFLKFLAEQQQWQLLAYIIENTDDAHRDDDVYHDLLHLAAASDNKDAPIAIEELLKHVSQFLSNHDCANDRRYPGFPVEQAARKGHWHFVTEFITKEKYPHLAKKRHAKLLITLFKDTKIDAARKIEITNHLLQAKANIKLLTQNEKDELISLLGEFLVTNTDVDGSATLYKLVEDLLDSGAKPQAGKLENWAKNKKWVVVNHFVKTTPDGSKDLNVYHELLHLAADSKSDEARAVIESLLKKGTKQVVVSHQCSQDPITRGFPVEQAVRAKNWKTILIFLKEGTEDDVNLKKAYAKIVHAVLISDDLTDKNKEKQELLEQLLEADADLSALTDDAKQDVIAEIKKLLKKSISPDFRNVLYKLLEKVPGISISEFVELKRWDIVVDFAKRHPARTPEQKADYTKALFAFIAEPSFLANVVEYAKALIDDAGADVSHTNDEGHSLMHVVMQKWIEREGSPVGHIEAYKELILYLHREHDFETLKIAFDQNKPGLVGFLDGNGVEIDYQLLTEFLESDRWACIDAVFKPIHLSSDSEHIERILKKAQALCDADADEDENSEAGANAKRFLRAQTEELFAKRDFGLCLQLARIGIWQCVESFLVRMKFQQLTPDFLTELQQLADSANQQRVSTLCHEKLTKLHLHTAFEVNNPDEVVSLLQDGAVVDFKVLSAYAEKGYWGCLDKVLDFVDVGEKSEEIKPIFLKLQKLMYATDNPDSEQAIKPLLRKVAYQLVKNKQFLLLLDFAEDGIWRGIESDIKTFQRENLGELELKRLQELLARQKPESLQNSQAMAVYNRRKAIVTTQSISKKSVDVKVTTQEEAKPSVEPTRLAWLWGGATAAVSVLSDYVVVSKSATEIRREYAEHVIKLQDIHTHLTEFGVERKDVMSRLERTHPGKCVDTDAFLRNQKAYQQACFELKQYQSTHANEAINFHGYHQISTKFRATIAAAEEFCVVIKREMDELSPLADYVEPSLR